MRNLFKQLTTASSQPRHARRVRDLPPLSAHVAFESASREVATLADATRVALADAEPVEDWVERISGLRATLRTADVIESARAARRRVERRTLEATFADGAAFRSGHECDTDAQALRLALDALHDRDRGARLAMLVLAGHAGMDPADLVAA